MLAIGSDFKKAYIVTVKYINPRFFIDSFQGLKNDQENNNRKRRSEYGAWCRKRSSRGKERIIYY